MLSVLFSQNSTYKSISIPCVHFSGRDMSCPERGSAYDEIYNEEIFDEDGRPKRTGKI